MKKQQVKVNLDADQAEWLRKQAVLFRCSISQVIRTLIAERQRGEA